MMFQLRVETYNTFNHTQFCHHQALAAKFDKNGLQTTTNFGQPTAAANPRIMQLAARLSF